MMKKAFGLVTVFRTLPSRISRLQELAYNVWWSWHPEARALYRTLDADLWEQVIHNPVRLLSKLHPGSTILYNLILSKSVTALIERDGGKAIRTRVGHSYIKEEMRKDNAIFGGEHSGHFYFRDNWFADSGLIAFLLILELISIENKSLSELIKPLETWVRSGEINTRVNDVGGKVKAIEEHFGKQALSVDHLDGVTIDYGDWWFNVRPSNTEPLLRLNVEAKTRLLMEQKRDEVVTCIRE